MQIVFPTFDLPPPKKHPSEPDGVGHWVTASLDLKRRCFQYIDSLWDQDSSSGWTIFSRMVKFIRILWKTLGKTMDPHLDPHTIDLWETRYMNTTKQTDG
jgi:hypothetical protein